MKKGENYPLLLVGRLGVGDSGTLGPRPTNCQSAYASCEGEFVSPGEMSGLMNGELIQKINFFKRPEAVGPKSGRSRILMLHLGCSGFLRVILGDHWAVFRPLGVASCPLGVAS